MARKTGTRKGGNTDEAAASDPTGAAPKLVPGPVPDLTRPADPGDAVPPQGTDAPQPDTLPDTGAPVDRVPPGDDDPLPEDSFPPSLADDPLPEDVPPSTPADLPPPHRPGAASVPPATPPAPPPPARERPREMLWPLLGGVLAAGLGAAAVLVALPQGWRPAPATTDPALESRIAALESRAPGVTPGDLSALADRIATLEAAEQPTPDLAPLENRIAALETASATPLPTDLAPRIDALEAGIGARIDAAVSAAVATALEPARAELERRAAGLAERAEDVAAAQSRVAARAALAALIAAAESGEAAPGALADLPDAPADLAPLAQGIATLPGLQQSFAPAAREALRAAPPPADAPLGSLVTDFLRSQTGARSLVPREGADTDAVLSRAEAALRRGDLAAALAEIDTLPEGPAQAMARWRNAAAERLSVLAALTGAQAQLDRGE